MIVWAQVSNLDMTQVATNWCCVLLASCIQKTRCIHPASKTNTDNTLTPKLLNRQCATTTELILQYSTSETTSIYYLHTIYSCMQDVTLLSAGMDHRNPSISLLHMVTHHIFERLIINSLANSPFFSIINHLTYHMQLTIPPGMRTTTSNLHDSSTLMAPHTTLSQWYPLSYGIANALSASHRSGDPTNSGSEALCSVQTNSSKTYLSLVVIINSLTQILGAFGWPWGRIHDAKKPSPAENNLKTN